MILIEGANIIDCAVAGHVTSGGALLIEGEEIRAVGSREEVLAQLGEAEAQRVDVNGGFVIPGLWDCHIHLGAAETPHDEAYAHELPAHQMLRSIRKAQDNLRCGITSLRALGDPFSHDIMLREAIDAGEIEGPRIFAAGNVWWSRSAAGEVEFRRCVRQMIQDGVDQVKLLSSGGIPWRSDTIGYGLHTKEEIAAAVDEAHSWGKPVAVHAMGDETVVGAAEAGADTVEHGFVVTERGLAAMAEANTIYCPNLTVTVAWDPARLAAKGYPSWFVRNAAEAASRHHAMFREAVRLGITVITGVDDLPEGRRPVGIEMHDDRVALWSEIELMARNGLSNGEALLAATRNAAASVRASDRLGTLEAGKLADFVVLKRNPVEDLAALATVQSVWKGGKKIRLEPGLEPGWHGGGLP